MEFHGNIEICNKIKASLEKSANDNFAFMQIFNMLKNSNLKIHIKDENEMIEDSRNKSKTLTEFRAYQLSNVINLFLTKYETQESLIYNFYHELCHALLRVNPLTLLLTYILNGDLLLKAGKDIELKKPYWEQIGFEEITKHDDVHDDLPEEKICYCFAEALTGTNYDRKWWRQNIISVDSNG
jgi:hemerythrin